MIIPTHHFLLLPCSVSMVMYTYFVLKYFFSFRFRRSNRIFAGLWFGKGKPHFPTFLRPFSLSLRELYHKGNMLSLWYFNSGHWGTPIEKKKKECFLKLLNWTCKIRLIWLFNSDNNMMAKKVGILLIKTPFWTSWFTCPPLLSPWAPWLLCMVIKMF